MTDDPDGAAASDHSASATHGGRAVAIHHEGAADRVEMLEKLLEAAESRLRDKDEIINLLRSRSAEQ